MDNIVEPYITSVISVFNNIKSTYESNINIQKEAEDELNDLNHEIELSHPKNASDGYKLYREIRDLRLKRRKAKEENELMEDFYKFLNQNHDFKNKIQQIQGSARKLIEKQQSRTYVPRRRNDLTIAGEHSTAYKPFEDQMKEFKKNKAFVKNGKLRRA